MKKTVSILASLLSRSRWFAAVVLALIAFVGLGVAQNSTGRIVGTVTDEQGRSIPGAKVTITNIGTNVRWEASTDDSGAYQVLNLPIATYRVTVENEGFTKAVSDPQPLMINQSLRVDIQMKVGAVTETVLVQGTAPQIETLTPTVGGTVTGAPIENLPLNGRDVLDLALTQAGVIPSAGTPLAGVVPTGKFSIAGGRDDSVTYLLDGGNNTSVIFGIPVASPNPDAIAEFRILTDNYTAEYGRSVGGVISVVTKSGTNNIHGSAFDYLRNDALNANNFFNNASIPSQPRPVLKRNQFGGTIGGPIILPRLVNGKDRLFFFFAYQGQRQTSTTVGSQLTVFTPQELNGDFSRSALDGSGNAVPDPGVVAFLQSHPYFLPGGGNPEDGKIDPAKIDSVARAYLAEGLVPSSPTGILAPNGPASNDRDEYTGRIDLDITRKDRLSVTLTGSHNPVRFSFVQTQAPNVPGYPGVTTSNNYFGNIGYTRTFSFTKVNEFRFTAQRVQLLLNYPDRVLPGPTELGIHTTTAPTPGPPVIILGASGPQFGFNLNGPGIDADNTYVFSDAFSWMSGRHTWKAGGSLAIIQSNGVAATTNGMFIFNGPAGIGTGNDRADLLLAMPNNYIQLPNASSAARSHQYAGFFQDEWKAASRLVLTLGVRYEYNTPKRDPQDRFSIIMPGLQSKRFINAPLGLVFPGDPGAPTGAYFPDRNNWASRFGFAWDLLGDGKMSLRGGFGVFYDAFLNVDMMYQTGNPPFASAAFLQLVSSNVPENGPIPFLSYPFQNACAGMDENGACVGYGVPYPVSPPIPPDLDFAAAGFIPFGPANFFIDPHLITPYSYQYNLSLQRQLGKDLAGEISYVGTSSHKLTTQVDMDPIVLGTGSRVLNTQPGLQIPNAFAQALGHRNAANANYNGLLLNLTKRVGEWGSFGESFFSVSYTLSHQIDDAGGLFRNTSQVPAYNYHQFRNSGDSDMRHRFVLSGGWELPFARLWSNGPKRLLTGWSLYPIVTVHSGLPMDVNAGLFVDGTPGPSGAGDQNIVRPDLLTKAVPIVDPHQSAYEFSDGSTRTGTYWFDPTVFGPPTPGTYGTLPRNSIRGPGRSNFDIALEKKTMLWGEKVQMMFRAEFFNVLNHTQWQNPIGGSASVFSPQLGQITSTFDPRIGQLSLRIVF